MSIAFINEYFFHEQLSGTAMDQLWTSGWRHFGRYFYRYSHLPDDKQIYSVTPLRLHLPEFSLRRSHKRIFKKNKELRVELKPAFVSDEVETLFEKHKSRFTENIPENIYVFVSHKPATLPCECLSLCVYEENKLIGVSYLDVGKEACSSVYQCFDPEASKRSLGIFMILLSIRYAHNAGKTLYYPGYAYKESSYYDYKKRFKGLEYFDWQGNWLPLEE